MAFGHAVMRHGFSQKITVHDEVGVSIGQGSSDDDQIKGDNNANMINGGDGDDVIIGKGGNDHLVGGDQEDDLSGGAGDDLLVGAIWDDSVGDVANAIDANDGFTQDDYSDDFNAEATFAENGEDTIWIYDDDPTDFGGSGVYDVIDLSDAIALVDTDISGDVSESELNAAFSYDSGELKDASDNVWFNVYQDAGTTAADTVYVEFNGDQFMWNGAGWDLL